MVFCSNCGKEISLEDHFCPNCGLNLNNICLSGYEERSYNNQRSMFDNEPIRKKTGFKNKKMVILSSVCVVVAVLLIVIFILCLAIDNSNSASVTVVASNNYGDEATVVVTIDDKEVGVYSVKGMSYVEKTYSVKWDKSLDTHRCIIKMKCTNMWGNSYDIEKTLSLNNGDKKVVELIR